MEGCRKERFDYAEDVKCGQISANARLGKVTPFQCQDKNSALSSSLFCRNDGLLEAILNVPSKVFKVRNTGAEPVIGTWSSILILPQYRHLYSKTNLTNTIRSSMSRRACQTVCSSYLNYSNSTPRSTNLFFVSTILHPAQISHPCPPKRAQRPCRSLHQSTRLHHESIATGSSPPFIEEFKKSCKFIN